MQTCGVRGTSYSFSIYQDAAMTTLALHCSTHGSSSVRALRSATQRCIRSELRCSSRISGSSFTHRRLHESRSWPRASQKDKFEASIGHDALTSSVRSVSSGRELRNVSADVSHDSSIIADASRDLRLRALNMGTQQYRPKK